eukprot:TRINITY_DN6305_c0_g2_i1.p1 TRINITY_DN6305_c0_g2~~TRINITY_DN6305_c0_g2_i1.p1  ORF type:complete len:266 (-),score=29.64 TRINITY_DN6305_c0_g2_i1:149-946(-)
MLEYFDRENPKKQALALALVRIAHKRLNSFLYLLFKTSPIVVALTSIQQSIVHSSALSALSQAKALSLKLHSMHTAYLPGRKCLAGEKMRSGFRLALVGIEKSSQKSLLWIYFNDWRKECMAATVNYMSDRLKTQQYSQVNLQIKLMDLLNKNTTLCEYSKFMERLSNVKNKWEFKRIQEITTLLDEDKSRKQKNYFNIWYTKAYSTQKLIQLKENRLQMLKVLINIKARIKGNTSLSFVSIASNGAIMGHKINANRVGLKVNLL